MAENDNSAQSQSVKPAILTDSSAFKSVNPDIILRSADGVDFRVTKSVLVEASPFFHAMLSLPQPDTTSQVDSTSAATMLDGLPVIALTESSRVLDALLRICFPVEPPDEELKDLKLIDALLSVGDKYDMTRVVYEARKALRTPEFSEPGTALKVYIIAYRHRLANEARKAARDMLKGPGPCSSGYSVELEHITGGGLYHLEHYHQLVTRVILNFFSLPGTSQISPQYRECIKCEGETACGGTEYDTAGGRSKISAWWKYYRNIAKIAISNSGSPLSDAIFDFNAVSLSFEETSLSKCSACMLNVHWNVQRMFDYIRVERDRLISTVCSILRRKDPPDPSPLPFPG